MGVVDLNRATRLRFFRGAGQIANWHSLGDNSLLINSLNLTWCLLTLLGLRLSGVVAAPEYVG